MADININAFKQEAQQTIQRINGNIGGIYDTNASSIYANTFLASGGYDVGGYGAGSAPSIWASPQSVYNQYSYSTGSVDSDMVKALGADIRSLAARNDQILASIIANSQNQAAQAQAGQGQIQPVNLNNSAEGFSKLTTEQRDKLAEKEKEIKDAEEAKAKETDAAQKNEKQKAIDKLKSEYRALEKEYGTEGMAELFGTEFNFYGNIDDKELSQIQEANGEIESMRSELEGKRTRFNEKWAEIQKKVTEYAMQHGIKPNPEVVMSEAQKTYFENSKKDIEKLEKEITEKIKNLNANITSSAKDDKTTYFASANADRAEENKAKAAKQSVADAVGAMWTEKDGKKVFNENAFDEKFNAIKGDDVNDADKEAVKKFIKAQAKAAGDADKFKEKLGEEEFFEALAKTDAGIIGQPNEKANIKLMQKFYDEIMGGGKFAENAGNCSGDGKPANSIKNILAAIEAEEKAKAAKPATTPPKAGGANGTSGAGGADGNGEKTATTLLDEKFAELSTNQEFEKADKDAIKNFMAEKAKGMKEAEFKEYLATGDFFKDLLTERAILTAENGVAKANIKLIQSIYDEVVGGGAFDKKVQGFTNGTQLAQIKNLWTEANASAVETGETTTSEESKTAAQEKTFDSEALKGHLTSAGLQAISQRIEKADDKAQAIADLSPEELVAYMSSNNSRKLNPRSLYPTPVMYSTVQSLYGKPDVIPTIVSKLNEAAKQAGVDERLFLKDDDSYFFMPNNAAIVCRKYDDGYSQLATVSNANAVKSFANISPRAFNGALNELCNAIVRKQA